MINQLDATADCYQQTALEGLASWLMIVDSSEGWNATSRIVVCSAVCSLQTYSSSLSPVSFPLTVASNDVDHSHSGSVALLITIAYEGWH